MADVLSLAQAGLQWLEQSWLGHGVRSSSYVLPALQCLHLLGMVVAFGSLIAITLQVSGIGMRGQSAASVVDTLAPFFWGGLTTLALTGLSLLSAQPMRYLANTAFCWKMGFLTLAFIWCAFTCQRIAHHDRPTKASLSTTTTAIVSLLLWLAVAAAGRAIAFVP